MTADEIFEALRSDAPLAPVITLTCTLYGEARGEPLRGLVAIWNVIHNRALADLGGDAQPDWWGEGVVGVCLKAHQFSCWWEEGPNKTAVFSLAEQLLLSPLIVLHPKIERVRAIAALALDGDGLFIDVTGGATHYLTTALYLSARCPAWAHGREPTVRIGAHAFFKL